MIRSGNQRPEGAPPPDTLLPVESSTARGNTAPPIIDADIVEPVTPRDRGRHGRDRNGAVQPTLVSPLPPCPNCGTPRDRDTRFCVACSAPLETADDDASVVRSQPLPEHHFRCQTCGSEVNTSLDQVSYRCPFCDSNYVIELPARSSQDHQPEFIIGFAITSDKAAELFYQWMKQNSWFRPGDLSARSIMDKQRGVYLPFWQFSMGAESRWRAQIGEYWYRTETYTVKNAKGETETRTRQVRETEWFPLAGEHHEYYYGYIVPAGRSLSDTEARDIQPYRLASLTRYRPHFLAGWMCEDDTVPRDDARMLCENEFLRREKNAVAGFLPGDEHSDLRVETQLTVHDSDLVLLPVHILTYRYKDKLYRFIVNGQTGKVIGQKPVSTPRIAAAVGAVLLFILIIVLIIIFLNR
jgi:predicted RNA-binding Zn-ribbon protein involved in translation (DUF1610 family)